MIFERINYEVSIVYQLIDAALIVNFSYFKIQILVKRD